MIFIRYRFVELVRDETAGGAVWFQSKATHRPMAVVYDPRLRHHDRFMVGSREHAGQVRA